MKIDVSYLRMDFPDSPSSVRTYREEGKMFFDYDVLGFIEDERVALLRLCRATRYPFTELNDFWYDLDLNLSSLPRPVAVYQETDERFYGKGISGKMIILANEIAKERFKQPIASDITFLSNPSDNWQEMGFANHPAKRVWEKLEERGLAYRRDYLSGVRWVMK